MGTRKANASESLLTCRNSSRWHQNQGLALQSWDEPGGCPLTGQVVPGMEATRAWSAAAARNVGRRTPKQAPATRLPVARGSLPSHGLGTEYRRGAGRRTGS